MDERILKEAVQRHCPKAGGKIGLEPIPTGKFNSSFFVRAGNEQLVLRVAPPDDDVFVFYEKEMMRQEPELHRLLLEGSSVPVAPIVAFDDSREVVDRNFLLMERLPGRPLTEAPEIDFDRVLFQVGEYLKQAHGLRAEQYGYLGAHRPMEPQSNWESAFVVMWNRMIDDIVGVGFYDEKESGFMRRLLDERLELFSRQAPSCMLHMDIWLQNILVGDRGEVSGIVDWDRGLWGDPEIEFAVLDYCGISEPAFWEGYGQARDRSPEAQVRQVFYLLYEIQKYIVIRAGRNGDRLGARGYKDRVMEIVRQGLLAR